MSARKRDADLNALSRRIRGAAGPSLLQRRHRPTPAFDYITRWSQVLWPAGMLCAAIGVFALATGSADRPAVTSPETHLLGAVANRVTTPELVDVILRPAE